MCGIIGIVSKPSFAQNNQTTCASTVLTGLKYLQNRGYDSAGMFTVSNKDGNVVTRLTKFASTDEKNAVNYLEEGIEVHSNSYIGLGHTRWATHGAKTDTNSHPHTSADGKFILVHNGIIENYAVLKKSLQDKGVVFTSETDTEVIVNLLSTVYVASDQDLEIDPVEVAIQEAERLMNGTWGIVVFCSDYPDRLYCSRRGSPILIGNAENEVLISSEQSGFGGAVNTYFVLGKDDICRIMIPECPDDEITVHCSKSYDFKETNKMLVKETPAPFDHWTMYEINEQITSSRNAISLGGRVKSCNEVRLGGLMDYTELIQGIDNLILLGCGTSFHSAFIASNYLKDMCGLNTVQIFDGAEFSDKDIPKIGKTACIFISQSGETKDLHRCLSIVDEKDIFTIGVINVVDSLIAREVQCGVYLNAGSEVAVASTKAFSSQLIVLTMISVWIAQIKDISFTKRLKCITDLHNLSNHINQAIVISLNSITDEVLEIFDDRPSCFLLGKGMGEGTAREGALKIKEITYIHAEGYSSSALKHGPFALLDDKFPVILFVPSDQYFSKNMNAFEEIHSRGASVIVIHDVVEFFEDDISGGTCAFEKCVKSICVPQNKTFQALINMIPIQILAYKLAIRRGINPDTPKNLAKVVTVE